MTCQLFKLHHYFKCAPSAPDRLAPGRGWDARTRLQQGTTKRKDEAGSWAAWPGIVPNSGVSIPLHVLRAGPTSQMLQQVDVPAVGRMTAQPYALRSAPASTGRAILLTQAPLAAALTLSPTNTTPS